MCLVGVLSVSTGIRGVVLCVLLRTRSRKGGIFLRSLTALLLDYRYYYDTCSIIVKYHNCYLCCLSDESQLKRSTKSTKSYDVSSVFSSSCCVRSQEGYAVFVVDKNSAQHQPARESVYWYIVTGICYIMSILISHTYIAGADEGISFSWRAHGE